MTSVRFSRASAEAGHRLVGLPSISSSASLFCSSGLYLRTRTKFHLNDAGQCAIHLHSLLQAVIDRVTIPERDVHERMQGRDSLNSDMEA